LPLVANCSGVRIYINSFDHPPPHVHVFEAENEAIISIKTLESEKGEIRRKTYQKVKEWMVKNHAELLDRWSLAQNGEIFDRIEEC